METVKVYAKALVTDAYGDEVYGDVPPGAEPVSTLSVLVAPNHDPLRIAIGRVSVPIKFDIYYRGTEPTGIDPELHVVEVRGDRYEVDTKPAEWSWMSGPYAGDHFTVTERKHGSGGAESSSSSSS